MTIDVSAIGWRSEPTKYRYGWQQLALYALGIGAQTAELPYLYEAHGPKVFPSFAVVPAFAHALACVQRAQVSVAAIIHTAQTIRVLSPMGSHGEVSTYGEIVGFYDLKRFSQMLIRTFTSNEQGAPVYECDWMILIRDEGGFGGPLPPKHYTTKHPGAVVPAWSVEQKTTAEQAILYRLSGDRNPLHIDPEVARQAGFERGPILHGLATLGFATRAIVQASCAGQADRIRFIQGQFRKPVWPSETLRTDAWTIDDKDGTRHVYATTVVEREELVLTGTWKQDPP